MAVAAHFPDAEAARWFCTPASGFHREQIASGQTIGRNMKNAWKAECSVMTPYQTGITVQAANNRTLRIRATSSVPVHTM
jgi:hypothetical protein